METSGDFFRYILVQYVNIIITIHGFLFRYSALYLYWSPVEGVVFFWGECNSKTGSKMHTVTFSEDITYHPSHSRRTVQAQHGGGRITKPPVPRNGYLRHHYARDTYLRERSLSEPRHIKLRSKSHTPVPGLRPEVQTLWTNQSNNVQQRHHQRRLYGINEEGSVDEELGHREPTPRGFSASYDAAGMLAGPFYPEAKEEEEEDWSSLFVRNSLRDDDANFTVPAVLPDGRHVTVGETLYILNFCTSRTCSSVH